MVLLLRRQVRRQACDGSRLEDWNNAAATAAVNDARDPRPRNPRGAGEALQAAAVQVDAVWTVVSFLAALPHSPVTALE